MLILTMSLARPLSAILVATIATVTAARTRQLPAPGLIGRCLAGDALQVTLS